MLHHRQSTFSFYSVKKTKNNRFLLWSGKCNGKMGDKISCCTFWDEMKKDGNIWQHKVSRKGSLWYWEAASLRQKCGSPTRHCSSTVQALNKVKTLVNVLIITFVLVFFDRKHSWEVDSGGETLLSQRSHHPRWKQERPAQRRAHTPRAGKDETGGSGLAGLWGPWFMFYFRVSNKCIVVY